MTLDETRYLVTERQYEYMRRMGFEIDRLVTRAMLDKEKTGVRNVVKAYDGKEGATYGLQIW